MHVVTTRRRSEEAEYTATLLRRSYRENGKVKKETLANLSHLPEEAIDAIRRVLRGETLMSVEDAFEIERSLPAGHVNAALAMARRLGLAALLDPRSCRERDVCMAMIVGRVIEPASSSGRSVRSRTPRWVRSSAWLAVMRMICTARWTGSGSARTGLRTAWRAAIWLMGRWCSMTCPPATLRGVAVRWRSWGTRATASGGLLQIIYGLLCDMAGRPVAVEVFTGELHDDKTLPSQIEKLKGRFGLSRVVVVSDRGMVTEANIKLMRGQDGVDWITALKAPTIKKLARSGVFQPSLFDEQNLATITDVKDFPGERLIVCRNPLVAAQRARTREELMVATEKDLADIAQRVTNGTLTGADQIGLAVGPAVKRHRMRKHFQLAITDTTFTYERKHEQITAEAALDGFYILRTGLSAETLAEADVVRAYKNLEQAERAFGSFKGPDLQIRPIHHHLEDRVRAHVLICMLAYYLTWHLKAAWKPLLFTDEARPVNPDPVAKAVRSPSAERKAQTKRTTTGQACHSYRSLLTELATQTRNTTRLAGSTATFAKLTVPTPLQAHAHELIATAPVVT